MNDIISEYFETDRYRQYVKTVNLKKGETILRPHDDTNIIYALDEGYAKLYNFDSRGKEYIAVIYGPGDFYPLAWLMNQRRPPIYFKTITDCTLQVIPRKIFQKRMKEDINFSNSFMRRVIEQFGYYASTVNNLGLKYSRERLYYKLLVLASKFGEKKDGVIVIPRIGHSDLGATIHTTRENVSKEISKLEKLGVLAHNRTNIILKDTNYLQKALGESVPIAFFGDF